jgi:hypothetical protein
VKNFWNRLLGASKAADKTQPALLPAPGSALEARWASVWVGDLTDELSLDGYLGPAFLRDHGCLPHENSEFVVLPAAVPLADLLHGAFLADYWGEQLIAAAASAGVSSASCALIRLHYHHTEDIPSQSPLRFVGAVPFRMGP